jgi:hypothetical protein
MQTLPDGKRADEDTSNVPVPRVEGESLHEVLATQARDRTTLELSAGALVGAANAAVIWLRFPSVHWLAAGFAATASYALWGLADRKLATLDQSPDDQRRSRTLMRMARFAAGAVGWTAALFAVGAFLTAALGGLSLPGR